MVSGFRSMDVEAANGEEEPLRGGEPPSQAPGTSTLFRGRKQRWRWSWDWHWVVFATTLAGALTGAIIIGLYAAPPANRHHRALPNVIIDPFVARDWRGRPRSVRGTRGVVASDAGACSALGASVLDLGGNAIDAAVATTICEGVVNPSASGIGGGCFLLYRCARWPPRRACSLRGAALDASTILGMHAGVRTGPPRSSTPGSTRRRLPASTCTQSTKSSSSGAARPWPSPSNCSGCGARGSDTGSCPGSLFSSPPFGERLALTLLCAYACLCTGAGLPSGSTSLSQAGRAGVPCARVAGGQRGVVLPRHRRGPGLCRGVGGA